MTRKWKLRIGMGLIAFTLLSALSTYMFVRSAVVDMFGGKTDVAVLTVSTAQADTVYITNVNVLTPMAEAFIEKQMVGVENGKITFVGLLAVLPDNAKTIDGNGMFLVPGYTDSHVHLWRSENDLLLYIANGVTQVREMHGIGLHLKWKREIEEGRLGPDLYVVAAQLATYNFAEGVWIDMTAERNVVRSEGGVTRTIRSLKSQGFDAMKASSFLNLASYQWTSAETNKHSVPLTGHIPLEATLDDLWSSNQTEVAHVEEFVKGLDREFGGYSRETADEFLRFVQHRSADVAQKALDNDISVTTTLALIESFVPQKTALDKTLQNINLAYVNPGVAEGQAMGWLPEVNRYRIADQYKMDGWQDRSRAYWSTYVEAHHILLSAFREANVTLMVGTDANVPVMVPGFSIHDEMKSLYNAGMSTTEILAAATKAPAKWMGNNTGQIRSGYDANMVLLRENPLLDIEATDEIEMVFTNGHILDRKALDDILNSVLASNDASRTVSIEQFE